MYNLEVHYLDVGQGDCTLIVIRGEEEENQTTEFDERILKTILIDCGTKGTSTIAGNDYFASSTVPWQVLNRKLQQLRIQRIDILIVTHFDEDHFNGIVAMLEEYQAIGENPTRKEHIRLRGLLTGTKIYDQGVIFLKSHAAFRSEPPEYFSMLNSHNLREQPIWWDADREEEYDSAETFRETLTNFTYNTGFGPTSILPTKNRKDPTTSFTGQELYEKYSNVIKNNRIERQTERVFVGHFTQHKDGIGPILSDAFDPNAGPVPDVAPPDWVRIQKKLWGPTSSVLNEEYISDRNSFWTWARKSTNLTIPGRSSRPSKRTKGFRYIPIERAPEMYSVNALPLDHLIGEDILFDTFKGAIQFTCIAANGRALKEIEQNGLDEHGKPIKTIRTKRAYSGQGTDNHFGLGFLLKYENFTHWFGGDLEQEQEEASIDAMHMLAPKGLTAMKASHHGSNKASTNIFLRELTPAVVFISAGKDGNQLPGVETLNRLNNHSFVKHVFMTGTDEYKEKNMSRLPDNFPYNLTITTPNSKFFIAGSEDAPGDIKLSVSSTDALEMSGKVEFIDQNRLFYLKDPSSFSRSVELFRKPAPRFLQLSSLDIIEYVDTNNDRMDVDPEFTNDVILIRPSHIHDSNPEKTILRGTIKSQINRISFQKPTTKE